MTASNLLDLLRTKTVVDCDTLDAEIGEQLGPFHDCTSNQAIAYKEFQKSKHEDLLKEAVTSAKNLCKTDFERATPAELAVEISVCFLIACSHLPSPADLEDGQLVPPDAQPYERLRPHPNEPFLLLLYPKDVE